MPAPPEVLNRLAGRLDPSAWDVPGSQARIRRAVDDAEEWDLVVSGSASRSRGPATPAPNR